MHIFLQIILLALGFVMLVKGADLFVDGASQIAKRFGIPELIIGLTIVAMGTSAPEAAVSITGAVKGNADISIGNVVGSNILNVLVILGLAAAIVPIALKRSTIIIEIPFMIAITGLLLLLGLDGTVGRLDGVILWAAFAAYLAYLFIMAKKDPQETDENSRQLSVARSVIFTLLGLVMIVFGSDFAVDAASELARIFGMSERFIGLTIVALGTSLPELFTSVSAAGKGNADIAIGNIVGSNIFNILFVIGTSSLMIPINFAKNFRADMLIAAAAGLALLLCAAKSKRLERWGGAVLLAGYCAYFAYIL